PYWWINAIGLNKDGLIVENSGWGFGTTGTSICTYDVQKQCNFSDMNGLNEKQKSAILGLCGKEIISGYLDQNGHPDQSIKPDIPIKRSEFAKIIAKADGFKEDAKPNNLQKTSFFTDVPENQWYYKYVVYVYSKSFMQGNNNTREKFRPSDEINRAEAIKTIYEMSKGKIMSYLDSSNCYLIKGGKLSCLSGSSVSLEGIGCPAFDTKWYCTSVSYLRAMDCLTDDYISSQEELFRSITRKEAFAILNCIITKTEG
ncbi:MAG: S-layer homology domain-containing protein, partial [Thiotrichaceae bacterium]